jgi:glucuronokinase
LLAFDGFFGSRDAFLLFVLPHLLPTETIFWYNTAMDFIRSRVFARAGLIGNPSDGYNGKTITIIVKNFWAQVILYEWDRLEIIPGSSDESDFPSIHDLAKDVRLHGYYGGIRLIKAAINGFVLYCNERKLTLKDRNFSLRYESSIPRQVGMAGSSVIVVATLRALKNFYEIDIPKRVLPSLVLSIERDQLGIPAGLQDRVAQVYEGCVYMNFAKEVMTTEDGFIVGEYEDLPVSLLPPLYVSYSVDCSEPTEVFHNNLRFRYDQGEPAVVSAMQQCADLTVRAREALLAGQYELLPDLLDANFNVRRSICQLPKEQILMVETARSCGASANFAGSGGAIVGTYPDEAAFLKLQDEMKKIGCETVKPILE